MIFKRGEVYLVDLNPTQGAEMQKERPCVIVSSDAINQNASIVIICPITDAYGKTSPVHIEISTGEGGLSKLSIAHCGQIRAVDKLRLFRKIGELSNTTMDNITKGIAHATNIPLK